MNNNPSAINVGCDWLTATYGLVEDMERIRGVYQEVRDFGPQKGWSWYGYEGHQLSDGSLATGYNPLAGRQIVVAKGAMAHKLLRKLRFTPKSVSRIDLQVTVMLDNPDPGLLQRAYDTATTRVMRKTHVISNDGGATVYLGSRQSQVFCRIYDAGVRHNLAGPGQCYRYEVEYKKPLAKPLTEMLLKAISNNPLEADELITERVAYDIMKRGVDTPWPARGVCELPSITLAHEGRDRRLTWLSGQVSSCVLKLMREGYDKDVLFSLIFGGAR